MPKFPFTSFFSNPFFTVQVMVGTTPLTSMKYPIGEKLEVLAAFGESYTSWEFAFQAEDLRLAGLYVPLPDGTKIVEIDGSITRTYQATPFHNQPHYRWIDPEQTAVAIRCKEVAG